MRRQQFFFQMNEQGGMLFWKYLQVFLSIIKTRSFRWTGLINGMKEKSKRYFRFLALDLHLTKHRIKPKQYQHREMLACLFLRNTWLLVCGLFLEDFYSPEQLEIWGFFSGKVFFVVSVVCFSKRLSHWSC